jgi:mannan endo-1,4-beta-mannosidase
VFVNSYAAAVDSLRANGINVPIMIDADQWGQNIDQLQRSAAPLLAKDPNHNLLFSIHMWWPYEYHSTSTGYASPGKRIIGEIKESVEKNIPLVIGEFSKISPSCKSSIPYDTLIEEATKNKIGWLAWAWMHGNNDGNGNNCYDMDMTDDGNYATLHNGTPRDKWAMDVTVTSPFSIKNTAVRPKWIVNGEYTTGTIVSPVGEELLVNGTFSEDLSGWTQGFWGGKATASLSEGMAKIQITDPGTNAWDLQFSQGVAISAGKTYVLQFDAKADAAMTIQVLVKNSSPYKGYLDKAVVLATAVKTFKFEFEPDEDNAAAVLGFQLGAKRAGDIYLDNLSLKEKASTAVLPRRASSSDLSLRAVANGFEWIRSAPLAGAATVRVVDLQGVELFRTTAKAGSTTGFVPSVGNGLRFVVLETAQARDVRTLTNTR